MTLEMRQALEKERIHVSEQIAQEHQEHLTIFALEGLTCASCVMRLEKGLRKVPGVKHASVNLATEQAVVTYDSAYTEIAHLLQKVEALGYKALPLSLAQPISLSSGDPDPSVLPERQTSFTVEGMTCASCSIRVEKELKKVVGVKYAHVNLATEVATITYDPTQTTIERIAQKVEAVGYKALPFERISPPSLPSSHQASLPPSLSTRETPSMLMPLRLQQEQDHLKRTQRTMMQKRTLLCLGITFSVPVVVLSMFFVNRFAYENVVLLLLTTPIWSLVGWQFHTRALKALRHGETTMDTLVSLGSTAAYGLSIGSTFFPQVVGSMTSYDSVSLIITLIFLGKYLEARAKSQATDAIGKLAALQPQIAHVVQDGNEIEVPIEQVKVGDILLVHPGDTVPVDGFVTAGASFVDEAMITGESIPVEKIPGDPLIGATINQYGLLRMCATNVGSDTVLTHIIRLVEQAQGSKAPIQRFADTISGVFVPLVLSISLLTFLLWACLEHIYPALIMIGMNPSSTMSGMNMNPWIIALVAAITVLVVACPCALGLATPTAIIVGTGKGAEHGILMKGGESLERLQKIKAVLLDKTGTITYGKPELTDVVTLPSIEHDELLRLVAAAEQGSEHPVASVIVAGAEASHLSLSSIPEQVTAIAGHGLEAVVEEHTLLIGTRRLFREREIASEALQEQLRQLEEQGKTVMMVALDGELVGLIAVLDRVKDSSAAAIRSLQEEGIEVLMITGDNRRAAQAIAAQVGLPSDHVLAEVLPEEKVKAVASLQRFGLQVAFVGDGVNDAPALAQADVGIAMGTGTMIAMEAADVTLVQGNPGSVGAALSLSRATMKTIKQNLFWAFAYNSLLIPMAMLSPLCPLLRDQAPMIAAAAMAFSSVTVVSNSLRLRSLRLRTDV